MIGIISDTHDNMEAIERAVRLFNDRGVELVLHAGDFVSPFTARVFGKLKAPMIGVFGNNDGDPVTLINFYKGIADIYPQWKKLEHKGKCIYLTHRPLPEPPSDCDLYVFGHTHEPVVESGGRCLVVNPGECAGWLSSRKTVVLADVESGDADIAEI
ncbi:MAG: metallophosphoesterase [Elusimicrobia bacterium]|nr:metallophosphoesterase [Elusimicrobiota bacterium]